MSNRLARASSPYLRQHAENPIDWFPWGEEAFTRAKAEDKPVLLSIGYSSCHWCHVMAHESFEDEGVAKALNRHFVCIKVDREERPDVDDTYMTAVQLSTGRGGWPMTLFLTPDKKPFFAGTYLPKNDRMGQPGFVSVIEGIAEGWRTSKAEFEEAANEFSQALAETIERNLPPAKSLPRGEQLRACLNALAHDFDPNNGGFGGAPKFPPHTAIELLLALRASEAVADPDRQHAGAIAEATLLSMALGGIRDHVGGGFHRYSTDAHWLLPHFEKMLVDNALMLANYARAARVLDRPMFASVATEIVGWLEREMLGPDGLYYSALDADSEGEEGRFYVWRWHEVKEVLGARAVPFMEAYGFAPNGNFDDEATGQRSGANIPHLSDAPTSDEFGQDILTLREARAKRTRPGLDDKALVGQNGLVIAGLVEAGRLHLASRTADALLRHGHGGRVPRLVYAGRAEGEGFLGDYAGLAFGLVKLGDAQPTSHWRDAARSLAQTVLRDFQASDGAFLASSSAHESLFGRSRPIFDSPAPSPIALICRVLNDLGMIEEATRALRAVSGWLPRAPTATEALHVALLELPFDERDITVRAEWVWTEPRQAGLVRLTIPSGMHVNGATPDQDWLVPTQIHSSAQIRVDFPPGDTFEGVVDIPVGVADCRLPFTLTVRWQACTASECLAPREVELEVR